MKRDKLIEEMLGIFSVSQIDLEYIINETAKAIFKDIDYKEYVCNGILYYNFTTNFDKLKKKWIKE